MLDELRRIPRVRVCCRVDVRQPYGVWNGVTRDLSARGCRIMTRQAPRLGARIPLMISSDLVSEELSTVGEVVWVTEEELGVIFLEEAKRSGSLSPSQWLARLLHEAEPERPSGTPAPARALPVVDQAPTAIPISSRRSG
jgi:hypothetical protein